MFCPSAFFARNDGTIGDSPIDCFGRFHDTMPHYNPNDVDRLTPMEVLSVSKLTLAEFDAMPMPPVSNQHPKQQLPLALAPVTEQSLIVRRASQNSDDPLHDPRYCSRSSQPVLTPSPQAQTCFKYDVGSNVFVCGLTSCITDADLMKLFSPFGPIESAKVMLDIHTGKSRGIAFVKFHAVADAQHAIAAMNGHQLNGRILSVRLADAKASFNPVEPSTKVFVRNLPTQITADRLREYFARFGAVADLKVRSDTVATPNADSAAAGSKRHIAFVSFYDAKVAARAVSATHTARPFPECGDVPLLAKFAVPSRRTEAPPAHAPAAKSPMSATSNNSVNVCATAAPMTMRATPLTQYATPIPHMPSPMTLPLCMPSYNPAPMTLPTYAAAPAWCVAPPQQPPTTWGYQQHQIVHLVVVSPASCGAPMGTTFCHMNNNNSAPIVLGGMVPSW